ncbi:hypothetical protein Leryth_007090, partial [Lithospermum erythrorhizon]
GEEGVYYEEEGVKGNVGILRNGKVNFGIRRNEVVDDVVIYSDGGGRLVEEVVYYEEEGIRGVGRVGIRRNQEGSVGIVRNNEGNGGIRRNREVDDVVEVYSEGSDRLVVESNEVVDDEGNDVGEEEKKEPQPYAVPTAGAFYMHDDRFRENAGGRGRRMLGGKNLWESKDERKWGHDKFEELTMHERQYDEGRRSSRGRNRGRGRSRGAPRGYSLGSRPKSYVHDKNLVNDNNKYQIKDTAPRSVRGRGPRRYRPSAMTNHDAPAPQNKQYRNSLEKSSRSGRASISASSTDSSHVPAKKQSGSSLNYASPPFYPSSTSNKEVSLTQKEDVHGAPASRNVQPSVVDQSFPMSQSNSVLQGNNNTGSVGLDKLYVDDSTSAEKSTNLKFTPSFSQSNNSSHSQHFRSKGRGLNTVPQASHQLATASNLVNQLSSPTHLVGRNSTESKTLATMQASSHQFVQHSVSVSQSASPPKAVVPINSLEAEELESLTESIKSNMSFIGNGKVNMQGGGKGSYIYGGGQVMGPSGNMIPGHGDQNLRNLLPVMQFGGKHPGGIGVPAVGMAFPGYVGNPQLGNSEMTWLPLLASAAGALGGTYCPPYFSLDGAYHVRPSAQTSVPSPASSNEVSNNSSNEERKLSQRPELVNDDFGQRPKNPRRYTEMKFDQ